jgi:hypothetical protein
MGDEAKPQSPEEVTPAHADAAFPVLLCIGGPAHGQLVERHPAQQSWVHIESAETYIRGASSTCKGSRTLSDS